MSYLFSNLPTYPASGSPFLSRPNSEPLPKFKSAGPVFPPLSRDLMPFFTSVVAASEGFFCNKFEDPPGSLLIWVEVVPVFSPVSLSFVKAPFPSPLSPNRLRISDIEGPEPDGSLFCKFKSFPLPSASAPPIVAEPVPVESFGGKFKSLPLPNAPAPPIVLLPVAVPPVPPVAAPLCHRERIFLTARRPLRQSWYLDSICLDRLSCRFVRHQSIAAGLWMSRSFSPRPVNGGGGVIFFFSVVVIDLPLDELPPTAPPIFRFLFDCTAPDCLLP